MISDSLFSYANRAKNIKNQPRINEDPKDALLRKFQDEIARLKDQLEGKGKRKGKSRRSRGENEDNDHEDPNDEELFLKEQQDQLNEERRAIQQKKNINGKNGTRSTMIMFFFRNRTRSTSQAVRRATK